MLGQVLRSLFLQGIGHSIGATSSWFGPRWDRCWKSLRVLIVRSSKVGWNKICLICMVVMQCVREICNSVRNFMCLKHLWAAFILRTFDFHWEGAGWCQAVLSVQRRHILKHYVLYALCLLHVPRFECEQLTPSLVLLLSGSRPLNFYVSPRSLAKIGTESALVSASLILSVLPTPLLPLSQRLMRLLV